MSLAVTAPLPGTIVPLDKVPDPVFAGRIVGPGIAIDPERHGEVTVVSPAAGQVSKLHPHAFIITCAQRRAVLVHLGLDTVRLEGRGFTLHAAEGDTVTTGQPILTWNPRQVEAGGLNPVVPLIALEAEEKDLRRAPGIEPGAEVAAGDHLLTWA